MMTLEYKGYVGNVEPDEDGLSGAVINARDVIHYEADTIPEIRKAFRESIDAYLAFCRERGEGHQFKCLRSRKPTGSRPIKAIGTNRHRL